MATLHEQYTGLFKELCVHEEGTIVKVYNYACKEDFDELWELQQDEPHHIIIVWGNTWNDGANPLLIPHLTPMDWALSYFANKAAGQRGAPFVYIVDLTGKIHDEWAMKSPQIGEILGIDKISGAMPRVRLYGFLTQNSFRQGYYHPVISMKGVEGLITTMGDGKYELNLRSEKTEDPNGEGGLEHNQEKLIELFRKWKNDSASWGSGDHHDINNLIGPALLIPDGIYGALARRACVDGFSPPPLFKEAGEKLEIEKKLCIIVVDDRIHDGWDRAFCSYFDLKDESEQGDTGFVQFQSNDQKNKVELQCYASPDLLIEKIRKNPKSPWNYKISNTDEETQEILFFDLRLFPRQDNAPSDEEKAYFKQVLCLAGPLAKIQKIQIKKLNDQINEFNKLKRGFKDLDLAEALLRQGRELEDQIKEKLVRQKEFNEDIKKINEWLSSDPKNEDHDPKDLEKIEIKAVTLLPRLLSMIDPSYPIILFSATGRRDIMELVKPHRNIITSFEKPDLDALSTSSKRQVAFDAFTGTLEQSLYIIRARVHCQQIVRAGAHCQQFEKQKQPDDDQTLNSKQYHIELFIDETGLAFDGDMSKLRVGGCFALFSTGTTRTEQEKADAFDDDLVRGGVVYTQYQRRGEEKLSRTLFKRRGCAEQLTKYLNTSDNKPDKIGLIALNAKEKDLKNTDNAFFRDNNGDRAFLNTLEILVEGFLYEGLPQIADSIGKNPKDISIAIFPATRKNTRKNKDGSELLDQFREYEYVSGMPYDDRYENSRELKDISQLSLTQKDFAPMVQRMVEQRSTGIINRKIQRALAVPLVNLESEVPKEFIQILCRQCKIRKSVSKLKHTYGSPLPQCPECQQRLVLDVRALHYVADQILTQCFEHQEFLCCRSTRFSITKVLGLLGSRYGFWAGDRIYWNSRLRYCDIWSAQHLPHENEENIAPSFIEFKEGFELPGDPSDTEQIKRLNSHLKEYIEQDGNTLPWEPKTLAGYGLWAGDRIYWHSGDRKYCQIEDEALRLLAGTKPSFVKFKEGFELPSDPNEDEEARRGSLIGGIKKYIMDNHKLPWKPVSLAGYGFWTGDRIYWHSGGRKFYQIGDEAGRPLLAGTKPSFVKFKEGFELPGDPHDYQQRADLNSRLKEYIEQDGNTLPWELIGACPRCNSNLYEGREENELQNLYKLPDNYTDFDKPKVDKFIKGGEFVDEVDADLKTIMRLSRQVDRGGPALAKAIAEFPSLLGAKKQTKTSEDEPERGTAEPIADRKPKLRELAAQRIVKMLPDLSQNDFFIIVDDLEQKQRQKKPNC